MSEPEIHRADPQEKKRLMWIALGAVAAAVATLFYVQWELTAIKGWLQAGELEFATARFHILLRGALLLMGVVGLIAGTLVGFSSWRVIREQRYPHQAARLVRDKAVVRGARAVWMGRLGFALAVAFYLVATLGTWWGWQTLAAVP
jgi:hypothetical protein